MGQAGPTRRSEAKFSFLIEKEMTKFEILDFACPEFAACSPQCSELVRKCSIADGCKMEASTKR
jgi:hypothetical protein